MHQHTQTQQHQCEISLLYIILCYVQRVQGHGVDIQYFAHGHAGGGIDDDEVLEQEDPAELAALQETD